MYGVPTGDVMRFVWDTSALLNIKEPDSSGYSPGHSLYKDLTDGWIVGSHFNIYPSIAVYELQASISRHRREGRTILREFYIVSENSVVYPVDQELIYRSEKLFDAPGFSELRGADLIFASIALLEDATLVTLDRGFATVAEDIRVLDLNESRESPKYRSNFRMTEINWDAL